MNTLIKFLWWVEPIFWCCISCNFKMVKSGSNIWISIWVINTPIKQMLKRDFTILFVQLLLTAPNFHFIQHHISNSVDNYFGTSSEFRNKIKIFSTRQYRSNNLYAKIIFFSCQFSKRIRLYAYCTCIHIVHVYHTYVI